jgi:hypothetical protein
MTLGASAARVFPLGRDSEPGCFAGAAAFLDAFELADVPVFPGHKHPEGGTLVRKARGVANTPEIDAMLAKLAAARKARKLPRLDDKAIAAWNGMMIDAFARGAEVLKDDAYRAAATKAAAFVLAHMRTPDGRLVRSVRLVDEKDAPRTPPQQGFLEDYAFVIRGLLALHRIERDPACGARWLDAAEALAAKADELFWDKEHGGYFFATPQPDLIARGKGLGDNATPGGNSVMAHDLIDLHRATGNPAYRAKAGALLAAFSGEMARSPRGSIHMIHAVERLLASATNVAPIGTACPSIINAPNTPAHAASDPDLAATDSLARVTPSASVERDPVAPGEIATVIVTLRIDDGWHVNANPASVGFLVPTVVDVRPAAELGDADAPALEAAEIAYPRASTLKAEGLGVDAIRVYDKTARITASVRVPPDAAPGSTIALRVLAKFQACSDAGVCLMPAEWTGQVRIRVGPSGRQEDANKPARPAPFSLHPGPGCEPQRAG